MSGLEAFIASPWLWVLIAALFILIELNAGSGDMLAIAAGALIIASLAAIGAGPEPAQGYMQWFAASTPAMALLIVWGMARAKGKTALARGALIAGAGSLTTAAVIGTAALEGHHIVGEAWVILLWALASASFVPLMRQLGKSQPPEFTPNQVPRGKGAEAGGEGLAATDGVNRATRPDGEPGG